MEFFSETNLILISIIFLSFFLLQIQLIIKEKRRKRIFQGANDLEGILTKYGNDIKDIREDLKKLDLSLKNTIKLGEKSVHKVGIVRFNPFSDTGGDQSFAIALLDGSESGIVISSIHAREGTRIYAKPIFKGDSKYNLSEEEKKAIKKAQEHENTTNTDTK